MIFNDPRFFFSKAERRATGIVLGIVFWFFAFIAGALVYYGLPREIFSPDYVLSFRFPAAALRDIFTPEVSLGVLIFLVLLHGVLERGKGDRSLAAFRRSKKAIHANGAAFLHPGTFSMVGRIIEEMRGRDIDSLVPVILQCSIEDKRIKSILAHLEIDREGFIKDLLMLRGLMDDSFEKEKIFSPRGPLFQRLLRESLLEALNLGQDYVMPEDLMLAILDENIPALKTFLARWNIRQDDVRSIAYTVNMSRRHFLRRGSRTVRHRIMNRAWTARPTYTLDRYASDLTDLAREGYAGFLVGHQVEVNACLRILNRVSKNNILLVGEAGSGKTTILEHIAWLISREEVPQKLFDKRLAVLDVGLLVAGAKNVGDLQNRVVEVVNDVVRAGNIILAIPDIHTMLTAGQGEGVSISTVLGPVFAQGAFQVIGLTDPQSYHKIIEPNSNFKSHFEMVTVKEICSEDALQVLAARARTLEQFEGITISYPALKKAIEFSDRYMHDKQFPAKALDLLGEAVELAKRNKKSILSEGDIASIVSERTGIPVMAVTREESETLLNLGEEIHKRIVDQEEAVNAISGVIRESRAGVRRTNAPVGSFLFVGPTGVGKTECAKALAEIYFKNPESMVRFDMSEYQTRESVYRMIGSPEGGETGQLTERMKHNPHSLLLLDEFEKAHANILDIFLQVLDDGRVTDASGTTIDFTNAVIIATSNAHSVYIMESLKAGKSTAEISQELKNRLTAYFKPELLNRFDDIIVFKPLSAEDLKHVAQFQLTELFLQLEKDRGINLHMTEEAATKLMELGYNPEFGARPLRHVIRKKVRDLVADEILKNKLVRGDSASIDYSGAGFTITKTT